MAASVAQWPATRERNHTSAATRASRNPAARASTGSTSRGTWAAPGDTGRSSKGVTGCCFSTTRLGVVAAGLRRSGCLAADAGRAPGATDEPDAAVAAAAVRVARVPAVPAADGFAEWAVT